MTVSAVDFSSDGKLMYSAGYDSVVRCWDMETNRTSPTHTIQHKKPVDIIAVKPSSTGEHIIATGCQQLTDNVRVLDCKTFGPETIAMHSADTTSRSDVRLFPSALRWGIHPSLSNCLLAGFTSIKQEDTDGLDIMNLGGIYLWDIRGRQQIKIHPNTRNVFDMSWSPHDPCFAVACVAGNNRGDRHAKSEVKIYQPNQGDRYSLLRVFQCPATDINDVVYSPHDNNLISVATTDGSVYVWDMRQDDRILHQFSHGEPLQPLEYAGIRQREKVDTGVRFAAWGHSRSRLYTGSSDGVVTCWDPYRATEDAKIVPSVARLDSGIMSGSFSPDYSKLLLGSASGRVDLLEVGNEDKSIRCSVPFQKLDAPQVPLKTGDSGAGAAAALLARQAVELRPMGALPIRQAVQGEEYHKTSYVDKSMDAPDLRESAAVFQSRLRDQLLSMDQCTIPKCKEMSRGMRVTAEEAGDSGRSADRIPTSLRDPVAPSSLLPSGMARCATCARSARLRAGERGPARCERCSFACLRCGGAAAATSSRAFCVECASCGAVWRADALGYTLIAPPQAAAAQSRKERKRTRARQLWGKGMRELEGEIELVSEDEQGAGGVADLLELRAGQVAHLEELQGRWSVDVDENF
ncbi:MAG: WD40 repeat domain-containing protein [Terriglobus roseus]|nr:WD40 repeat domain-containing protein [Terriglobus roseus]